MRRGLIPVSLLLSLVCMAIGPARAVSGDGPTLEARVKAAFIFNFIQFTTWPDGTFAKPDSPVVIGIVGPTPIEDALNAVAGQKTVNGRKLDVRRFSENDDLSECQVVIVGNGADADLVLRGTKSKCILTVGDFDGFTAAGGVIQFFVEDNKERFEVNTLAAERAHLQLSSKLLKLAKVVRK